ncbi:hypothetical protein [Pseudomonas aeruginosa]|uniref:hypothetical protein n=1 Tax=Pseudomonas aeruginosa TaxID=287 RepID=UPI000D69C5E4|nr:hypothetical protein [Pseudomonas aeruginosa]
MSYRIVTFTFATLLASISLQAMSNDSVTIDGKSYTAIEVNGQIYYSPDSVSENRRSRRSVDGQPPQRALYAGDVLLQGATGPELKASGTLLVESDAEQARALATRYGLHLRQSSGGIALLEAEPSTDLNQVAAQMRQEGLEVQVEITGQLLRPK